MRPRPVGQGQLPGGHRHPRGERGVHHDRAEDQAAAGQNGRGGSGPEAGRQRPGAGGVRGGATGVNWSCQFAIGCDNSLRLRIYGSKGTILWDQERCEEITLIREDGAARTIKRGYKAVTPAAAKYGRLPAGHTEGWLEAMGNLYDSFTQCVAAKQAGTFTEDMIDYPTIDAGIQGLKYVEACLESNEKGNVWVTL